MSLMVNSDFTLSKGHQLFHDGLDQKLIPIQVWFIIHVLHVIHFYAGINIIIFKFMQMRHFSMVTNKFATALDTKIQLCVNIGSKFQ